MRKRLVVCCVVLCSVVLCCVCGTNHSQHGVSVQARADYAPNWVAEHLGASSRRHRHPFPALMAGEPWPCACAHGPTSTRERGAITCPERRQNTLASCQASLSAMLVQTHGARQETPIVSKKLHHVLPACFSFCFLCFCPQFCFLCFFALSSLCIFHAFFEVTLVFFVC